MSKYATRDAAFARVQKLAAARQRCDEKLQRERNLHGVRPTKQSRQLYAILRNLNDALTEAEALVIRLCEDERTR